MQTRGIAKPLIGALGTVESLFMSLPMTWSMRMRFAQVLGIAVRWALYRFPSIYDYTIARNREFGMGKQEFGEMQSVYALNKVLLEIDRRGIPPAAVRQAVEEAERDEVSDLHLPIFLGRKLLGQADYARLLKGVPEF